MNHIKIAFATSYWTPGGWHPEHYEFYAETQALPPYFKEEVEKSEGERLSLLADKLATLILGRPVKGTHSLRVVDFDAGYAGDGIERCLGGAVAQRINEWHCNRSYVVVSGDRLYAFRHDTPEVLYSPHPFETSGLSPAEEASSGWRMASWKDFEALASFRKVRAWTNDPEFYIKPSPPTNLTRAITWKSFLEDYAPHRETPGIRLSDLKTYGTDQVDHVSLHNVWVLREGIITNDVYRSPGDKLIITERRHHFGEHIVVESAHPGDMSLEEFTEKFRPVTSDGEIRIFHKGNPQFDCWKEDRVWSLLQNDEDDGSYLTQGYSRRALGHVLTEVPWRPDIDYFIEFEDDQSQQDEEGHE